MCVTSTHWLFSLSWSYNPIRKHYDVYFHLDSKHFHSAKIATQFITAVFFSSLVDKNRILKSTLTTELIQCCSPNSFPSSMPSYDDWYMLNGSVASWTFQYEGLLGRCQKLVTLLLLNYLQCQNRDWLVCYADHKACSITGHHWYSIYLTLGDRLCFSLLLLLS